MERRFKIRINRDLRGTPEVRVIAADGAMLGVMPLAQALRLAMKEGLELVEVNPKADPPVCKILDFGKYNYDEKRNAAETRREIEDDDSADAVTVHQPVTWTSFEREGRASEYAAIPTKQKTRPPGWPTHKASPGPWGPVVTVIVRKPGDGVRDVVAMAISNHLDEEMHHRNATVSDDEKSEALAKVISVVSTTVPTLRRARYRRGGCPSQGTFARYASRVHDVEHPAMQRRR